MDITVQQILVPKKVYVGDAAELRCTFNSPEAALKELTAQGTAKLTNDSEYTDYVIKEISLAPAGVDFYQLSVSFVPWKTGELNISPLAIEGSDIVIHFQPVNIVSLISADEKSSTALRDTAAPLLLPGTAYRLYGALAIFIVLLIISIRLIVKRKSLMFYFDTKRLLRKYRKNKKAAISQLRKLSALDKSEATDAQLAERLQKIIRNYLEVRFDFPFTKAAASEIMPGFYKATGGVLSEKKEEAFGEIAAGFVRTDFIRYKSNAHFETDELQVFIEKTIKNIEILEFTEEKEKSDTSPSRHASLKALTDSFDGFPLGG